MNNDPRVKAYENSPYVQAHKAYEARLGRKPVDMSQLRRVSDAYAETRAGIEVQQKEQREQVTQGEHSILNAALNGRWLAQPPGSIFAPSKDELINGRKQP